MIEFISTIIIIIGALLAIAKIRYDFGFTDKK